MAKAQLKTKTKAKEVALAKQVEVVEDVDIVKREDDIDAEALLARAELGLQRLKNAKDSDFEKTPPTLLKLKDVGDKIRFVFLGVDTTGSYPKLHLAVPDEETGKPRLAKMNMTKAMQEFFCNPVQDWRENIGRAGQMEKLAEVAVKDQPGKFHQIDIGWLK